MKTIQLIRSPKFDNLLTPLGLLLVYRSTLYFLTLMAMSMMPNRARVVERNINAFPQNWFIDIFFRWDSGWYDRVVTQGYQISGHQNSTAFFPLYPYLVWAGEQISFNRYIWGLVISNISLLIGLCATYYLAKEIYSKTVAIRAVTLILVFPSSFFMSCYYSEGLYFFTTAVCVLAYYKRIFWLCGLFGFLAVLTRPTGITLFVALAGTEFILAVRHKKWPSLKTLWLILIPLALPCFMALLYYKTGDMWAFSKAQAGWGRSQTFPLITLYNEFMSINWYFPKSTDYGVDAMKTIDLISALGLIAGAIFMGIRRAPLAWTLYVALNVFMALSTGRVLSINRFAIVLFPIFIFLAERLQGKPRLENWLVYFWSMLLLFMQVRFATWYWAG